MQLKWCALYHGKELFNLIIEYCKHSWSYGLKKIPNTFLNLGCIFSSFLSQSDFTPWLFYIFQARKLAYFTNPLNKLLYLKSLTPLKTNFQQVRPFQPDGIGLAVICVVYQQTLTLNSSLN